MKIAIPLTDSDEFSPHYGASARFAVFDVDPPQRAIRRRMIVAPPDSEPCAWPPLLRAAGVSLVLAGGMGSGARHRMAEQGVDVVAGVAPAAPEALVAAWLEDRLIRSDQACDARGHGHPHADGGEPCGCGR